MFDIGWSELLVIGVVALLVVGPKELPALLRTIGRYMGIVKRQANEFRAQFDEAMRETEIAQLRKDMESIKADAESTLRGAEDSVKSELADARSEFDAISAATEAKPAADGVKPENEALESPPSTGSETSVEGSTEPAANGSTYNGAGQQAGDEGQGDRVVKSGT